MKRISLSDLRAKQVELERKIAEAEEREKISIGAYMQSITGESELVGVKKWMEENAILENKNKEVKANDGNGKLHTEATLAL